MTQSLPIFLPNFPKETNQVEFDKYYFTEKEDQNVTKILTDLTEKRKKVNEILLKEPTTASVEVIQLLNEYVALLSGLNQSSAPEKEKEKEKENGNEKGKEEGDQNSKQEVNDEKQEEKKDVKKDEIKEEKNTSKTPKVIPLARGICFTWSDFSRKTKEVSKGGIDFELNTALLNLGLWLITLAKFHLSQNDKGKMDQSQKEAFKSLSKAAGAFETLSEKETTLEKDSLCDLRKGVTKALKEICLAEGQCITIERAESGNQTPSLISSLCHDTSMKFQNAIDLLTSPNPVPNPSPNPKLLEYLNFKKKFILSKAYYYHGCHLMLPESTSSGKAVRSLEAAIQQLKDSKSSYEKFAEIEPQTNTKKSIEFFEKVLSEMAEKHDKVKKENDMVYFEPVPQEPEELPEPKCTIQPNKYEFPSTDKCWNQDVYSVLKAKSDQVEAAENAMKAKEKTAGCCFLF